MTRKKIQPLIGCSGYYYSNWKKGFYPEKCPPSKWLQHYSSIFNTVELNGTFYRMPRLSTLKKQAENTPDDFKFSVKMNKYVTHVLRLKETSPQITEFMELMEEGLGKKLHRVLVQMPPSFKFTEENVARLEEAPLGKKHVIEFRHTSWWNAETIKMLRRKKCTFCNVDFPGMETSFLHSGKEFYLRLHGNPVLFKSSYSDESLREFCQQVPAGSSPCAVYFNNTYYDAGYRNAERFRELWHDLQ